jgi:hypothetical protein
MVIGQHRCYCKKFPINENMAESSDKHKPGKKTFVAVNKKGTNVNVIIDNKEKEDSIVIAKIIVEGTAAVPSLNTSPTQNPPDFEGQKEDDLETNEVVNVVNDSAENFGNLTDSEFVDATPDVEVGQRSPVSQTTVPVMVQNDIDFLKDPWANMADLEDNTNLIQQVLEQPF